MAKGYLGIVRHNMAAVNLKSYTFAKELGITRQTISHFLAGRFKKVGKKNYRLIRAAIRERNLYPVKHRPRHRCPDCGKEHAIRVPQSESQP